MTSHHITSYQDMVSERLSIPPAELVSFSLPDCSIHNHLLDSYTEQIVTTLLHCASRCFPLRTPSASKSVVGWNENANHLKNASKFWHKVWEEAGCPSTGVLSAIKIKAKKRYKYEVRRLKRRQQFLLQDRLARSFASKRKVKFWVHVKRLMSRPSHPSPLVDGVNGKTEIANIFASKFSALLNKHSSSFRNSLLATIQSSLTYPHIFSVTVTEDQVAAAISQLKPHKSDASSVTSEHIKFASPVIITPLSLFFTAVLRHGHMPQCFQDSVIVPVPKGKKDPSKSLNYCPITLSSSFSKILERLILSNYQSFLTTSSLQFGFKTGSSTTLCSATVKNIISRYTHNGSSVYTWQFSGCQ